MDFNLWSYIKSIEYNKFLYLMYVRGFRKIFPYTPLYKDELSKKNALKVMNEDWDYLILLDGCRYDLFNMIVDEDPDFIISGGGCTQEWVEWNFNDKFDDTVYIAGNPHLSSINLKKTFGFLPFFKVIDVWDFGWDPDVNTVPPSKINEVTKSSINQYPDKKIIIHYNQPHHPFIGDKRLRELDDGAWKDVEGEMEGGTKTTIWDAFRMGKVSKEEVWKGYKNNLKIVMGYVDTLLEELDGKVIITSDHGNHLGELMLYSHHRDIRTEELVKVPWYVAKKGDQSQNMDTKDRKEKKLLLDKIQKLYKNDNI